MSVRLKKERYSRPRYTAWPGPRFASLALDKAPCEKVRTTPITISKYNLQTTNTTRTDPSISVTQLWKWSSVYKLHYKSCISSIPQNAVGSSVPCSAAASLAAHGTRCNGLASYLTLQYTPLENYVSPLEDLIKRTVQRKRLGHQHGPSVSGKRAFLVFLVLRVFLSWYWVTDDVYSSRGSFCDFNV